ncbi:hypothetical protein Sjap_008715 [Stephania japonica]|uniref:Uncharacterized protein n=1 Tax=Stephania japonica TaxID=461633 RepID=A0AAP0JQS3_9MAGN
MPGVISVFPNFRRSLHTTHSWDFMGLFPDESMEIPGFSTSNQHNVIIGFIDTGIWPESPSFSDLNLPPVPSTWKGECQEGEAFNASSCNRKVIGARYYLGGFEAEEGSIKTKDFRSPRDSSGHGCHTASIAAGRYVKNMNFNGLGAGGARGGAPLARIVAYKTCWDSGCYDVDILAAFDDAIKDGVDILSISLGPDAPQGDYFKDAISIGSFHAVSHGIVVVSSVGNERTEGSATNVAPWIITVSASSTDRDFRSEIILGGRTTYTGESLTKREINASTRIISASKAFSGYFTPYQSSYCLESSLDNAKASGKVLVCRHAESSFESKLAKSIVVKKAGGVGMILIDEEDQDVAIPFVIPAAIVGTHTGDRILAYVNSSRRPTARILSSKTVLGSRPAPQVASFSSRGPNALTPEILKPDVTAPGLNILAACSLAMVLDKKWKHITIDPTGRRGNPFDFGAGFLNPTRVLNPGLVYDAQPEDYKAFLCSVGYDEKSLHLVTGDNSTCNKQIYQSAADLNYPSISVPNLRDSYSVTRTLTNVGRPRSIYKAFWSSPVGINVTVSPKLLVFKKYGEKVNFTVNFKVTAPSKGYRFGTLTWRRGKLRVSSPLVVRVVSSDSGLLR